MRLGLIDYTQPVDLYAGYKKHNLHTVLTQQEAGIVHPIAIISHHLCRREPSPEPLVVELEAAVWYMHALQRYTLFVPFTCVHMANPAQI